MGAPVLFFMPITQRIMGQMEVEIMIQDGHQIFADDAWLIIDLEKTYMINKVVINWEAAYGKAYDILVSVYGK